MYKENIGDALVDVCSSFKRYNLVFLYGWQDIKQRYRRSLLGPFWLTISMGVLIGTIGLIFGSIFNRKIEVFLPHLAVGLIFWTFFTTSISEGCSAFISSRSIIKQLPIPLFTHVLRVIWKNLLILSHNLMIFPLVIIIIQKPLGKVAFLSIIGFLLVLINIGWITLLLGLLCTRFRDLTQIIVSILQVLFYLTPIIWMPSLISNSSLSHYLRLNPIYHWLEVTRSPLLGDEPSLTSWITVTILGVVGWIFTLVFYGKFKKRIVYWV